MGNEKIKKLTPQGIISRTFSDTSLHSLAGTHDSNYEYIYSGSFKNSGSASITFQLQLNSFASGKASITLASGEIVNFKNLPVGEIQLMASGTVAIMAIEFSAPVDYDFKPDIFFQS